MTPTPSPVPIPGADPGADPRGPVGAPSPVLVGLQVRALGDRFGTQQTAGLQTDQPPIPSPEAEALNRWLLHQLEDDDRRAALYAALSGDPWRGTLNFPSRHALDLDPAPAFEPPVLHDHEVVTLIANRGDIEFVLRNEDRAFSNRSYRALGAGNFMLGLDPGADTDTDPLTDPQTRLYRAQRDAVRGAPPPPASSANAHRGLPGLRITPEVNERLIALALEGAAVTGLAHRHFDLADHAQEVALRYAGLLFGFAASDHALLREAMARSYRGLTYQMLGRHFVSEPETLPQSREKLALLASRADALIRRYAALESFPEEPPPPWTLHPDRHLWPEGVDPPQRLGLSGFTPLLQAWAVTPSTLSGQQLATLAVGMLAGIVGNVQASVCIAVDALLGRPQASGAGLAADIGAALGRHPPAPFLPRITTEPVQLPSGRRLPAGRQCILALGAACSAPPRPASRADLPVDPMVFGLMPATDAVPGLHWCLGAHVVWPLVVGAVRQVLTLPGVAQRIDPVDGEALRLEKRWGFACVRQPLEYRRDRCRVQQPLQVIMRIKTPVAANAERIRQIIRNGAPRIERALREARHVHFAWFQLVDDETQLALQTVYDGEFDAYVQHFALKVDDVFDQLFEYIEGAPPLPVGQNPEAFVETIRRCNRAPLGGYFFSAYPQLEVWNIGRGGRGGA